MAVRPEPFLMSSRPAKDGCSQRLQRSSGYPVEFRWGPLIAVPFSSAGALWPLYPSVLSPSAPERMLVAGSGRLRVCNPICARGHKHIGHHLQ